MLRLLAHLPCTENSLSLEAPRGHRRVCFSGGRHLDLTLLLLSGLYGLQLMSGGLLTGNVCPQNVRSQTLTSLLGTQKLGVNPLSRSQVLHLPLT